MVAAAWMVVFKKRLSLMRFLISVSTILPQAKKPKCGAGSYAGALIAGRPREREAGLDYCESDVIALANLLPAMLPHLDLQHALIRGRYSGPAVSAMQHEGIPIDTATLQFVLDHWDGIIDELIAWIDADYGLYEGRTFKEKRFEAYLAQHRIPWDRTEHGHLKLDDDTFADAVKSFPILEPLRNLRHSLGTMRLHALPVGSDGRNRVMLRQFASRTGRNQPSSAEFIFSPGVWLRGFIARGGYAIAREERRRIWNSSKAVQ